MLTEVTASRVDEIDAALASRARKRRKRLPAVTLPALRWRGGAQVSADAARGLLGLLTEDVEGAADPLLLEARAALGDDDASALLAAIYNAVEWTSANKWKVYAAGLLGDETQLRTMASLLQGWASSGGHLLASHGVAALRRNGVGAAIVWLDHLTLHGRGKVQREAGEALDARCAERGLDRDALVDLNLTRDPSPASDTVRAVALRFESAMLTGRSLGDAQLATLVTTACVRQSLEGVIVRDARGALALHTGDRLVDLDGDPVALVAPVTIPHPATLDDAALSRCRAALSSRGVAQPFAQIERPFTRDPEADAAALASRAVDYHALLARLDTLGYRRGEPQDAGIIYDAWRPIDARWLLRVDMSGYAASTGRGPSARDTLVRVSAHDREGRLVAAPIGLRCEALADLRRLVEG